MSFIKFYAKFKHIQNIFKTLPKSFSSKLKIFIIIETQGLCENGEKSTFRE